MYSVAAQEILFMLSMFTELIKVQYVKGIVLYRDLYLYVDVTWSGDVR